MTEHEKSKKLEKVKELLDLAGLSTEDYSLTLKKDKAREPLPPTVMLFQTFSSLASSELSPSACKVLFFFFSQTQYQNVISMDQHAISNHISMTERTVRSAVKELIDHGIITCVPMLSDRRRNEYFLNPYSSWKGSAKQRHEHISTIDENQLSMFGRDARQLKESEKEQMRLNKAKYTG